MPKIIEDEKIFHAVMQVVSERGYASATTKQMANAAHVSEVTLFRKYANKAQLVKQALASIVEQTDFVAATQYTGRCQPRIYCGCFSPIKIRLLNRGH